MLERSRKVLAQRPDLLAIYNLIPENSRIIDLGCGDGSLLYVLRKEKNVYGCGIEISEEKIINCVAAGVPVVHGNLDNGLKEYPEKSFNYVVLSQTLQAVKSPDKLLDEMARVGENVIISLINFGHYTIRFQLMFKGRMPISESLPTPWYKTSNIHLSTIKDFRELCQSKGLKIIREIPINPSFGLLGASWSNMFAPISVFLIKKD
ncbi:MAG: methionine biosynthesis protein MetW [Candidatus Nanoarchaeia archaeon]